MAELKCIAEKCNYNKDCLCSKGDIMVGGTHAKTSDDTCCESFIEKRDAGYTSSTSHPSTIISIDCDAVKCVYNSNYKCVAKQVNINGQNANTSKLTSCGTFKEKEA